MRLNDNGITNGFVTVSFLSISLTHSEVYMLNICLAV